MPVRFAKRFFEKKCDKLAYFFSAPIFCAVPLGAFFHESKGFRMAGKGKYRIDGDRGKLVLGRFELPFPRSRSGRIITGSLLIGGGFLGFLPVLGFWMVPLGLLVLSHDLPSVRRKRRRVAIWWRKRYPQVNRAGRG